MQGWYPGDEFMNIKNAAVGCTSIFYQSAEEPRFRVALRTAIAYEQAGIPLVMVSGSDKDPDVRLQLEAAGAIVLAEEQRGMANAYKQALRYAYDQGGRCFILQEAEKDTIPVYADKVIDVLEAGLYDILIIGRTERAIDSLPPIQRHTEVFAGRSLELQLAFPHDSFSGGRACTRYAAEWFLNHDTATEGGRWEYLFEPILKAMKEGASVGGIQLELIHPAELVAEELKEPEIFEPKRYMQLSMVAYLLERHKGWKLSL